MANIQNHFSSPDGPALFCMHPKKQLKALSKRCLNMDRSQRNQKLPQMFKLAELQCTPKKIKNKNLKLEKHHFETTLEDKSSVICCNPVMSRTSDVGHVICKQNKVKMRNFD